MKHRALRMGSAVLAGLLAIAGVCWLLTRLLADGETLYRGQSSFYWGDRLNSSVDMERNEALEVLNNDIIPDLSRVMCCDTNDSQWRLSVVEVLNGLPGINIPCAPAAARRGLAASGLGDFGPLAKEAIPALVESLKGHDDAVRSPAASSLGKIHGEPDLVIPLLIRYLDDNDVNADAAQALGEFGALSRAAVPKLIPMLQIKDKDLHYAVVGALKKIDPVAAAAAGAQ